MPFSFLTRNIRQAATSGRLAGRRQRIIEFANDQIKALLQKHGGKFVLLSLVQELSHTRDADAKGEAGSDYQPEVTCPV